MKIRFISYADGEKHMNYQSELSNHAKNFVDSVVSYNRDFLISTDFYLENKKILDQKRGAGYWLWKPYIILQEIKSMDEGDILFYLDCGDHFESDFIKFIFDKFNKEDINYLFLTFDGLNHPPHVKCKHVTKRDCFILMDCDSEIYHNSNQIEAGVLLFKKCNESISIIEEWLSFCKDENIITDIENIHGDNFDGFLDHRHDQSVLNNILIKRGINAVMVPSDIRFNVRK